jgi:hypothetical protein
MPPQVNSSHTRTVRLTLCLGSFGWAELERRALEEGASLHELVSRATSYLHRQSHDRHVARRVPLFAATGDGTPREVRVALPEVTLRGLQREARRQRVSLERLLAHAVLFYLAHAGAASSADKAA